MGKNPRSCVEGSGDSPYTESTKNAKGEKNMLRDRNDYIEAKRVLINHIERDGNIERLSNGVTKLAYLAPQFAENDSDLEWIQIIVRTKNFTQYMPIKRAESLMAAVRGLRPVGSTSFSDKCSKKATEYLDICRVKSKKKKYAKIGFGITCVIVVALLGVGFWYGDRTGFFYGDGDITFTANGQEYTQANAVKYNHYVQLNIPAKKGYDVTGIVDTKTNEQLFDESGKSLSVVSTKDLSDYANCNLEVIYEPRVYSAKIMTANSIATVSVPYTVEDEPEDVLDEPQQLDGYVFDGWFTDSRFKKPFTGDFMDYADMQQPLVLYPHYSLDGWTLTWDLQGGMFIANVPDEYTILTDVSLPNDDIVKKDGYSLKGWSMNGKLIDYFTPTIMRDVTLTAVWEEVNYTINYELNGGEIYDAESSYTIEDEFFIAEPVRKAYRFEGWYLNKIFTQPISVIERGTIGDKTIYAKWSPIVYTISYELNGGENSPLNPYTYTAEDNVLLFAPTRRGYRFQGWYKTEPADLKEELVAAVDASVTLTAFWVADEYTITVYPNNGSAIYTQSVKYDEGYAIVQPTKKGHSFQGFMMGNDTFESVGIYQFTMDIFVYANFTANSYNISYVSDGAKVYSQSVVYGQPYVLYSPDPKINYEFVGWYTQEVGGSKASDDVYLAEGNSVFYASWMKILTINLESDSVYTIDSTIEKAYIIGNYTGTNSLMKNVSINVSARDYDLTIELHNAGFKGKANSTAINCENSSYTLKIINVGISRIEGGNGSDGADGVSGSNMNADNRNGQNGNDGGHALNAGIVIFESINNHSELTLQGGSGGKGGDGGVDKDRSRMWLNYTPNGGNGGDSGSALYCVAYSINGTTVTFEQGAAGAKGNAGSRGDWWCAACYGSDGTAGKQRAAVSYK